MNLLRTATELGADDIHVTGPLDPADFNVDPLDYL